MSERNGMDRAFFEGGDEKAIEKFPKYRLMVTRHFNRNPDGSPTEEGRQEAINKGIKLGEDVELIKGYSSDEKTDRTYKTSELISKSSEIVSPLTNESYKTRRDKDIQYAILAPDFNNLLKEAKKIINEATIKECGFPGGTILEDLSKEDQAKAAPIREKNQELGFKFIFDHPEAAHRMSIGLANQLVKELGIIGRYAESRKRNDQPLKNDAILNTTTHGLFAESLFINAGYIKDENGVLKKITKEDLTKEKFGGYIMPNESFFLEIIDPNNIPEKIPVTFERANRAGQGEIFIDKNELFGLVEEYRQWKQDKK
jgi:hypothetical protein